MPAKLESYLEKVSEYVNNNYKELKKFGFSNADKNGRTDPILTISINAPKNIRNTSIKKFLWFFLSMKTHSEKNNLRVFSI